MARSPEQEEQEDSMSSGSDLGEEEGESRGIIAPLYVPADLQWLLTDIQDFVRASGGSSLSPTPGASCLGRPRHSRLDR